MHQTVHSKGDMAAYANGKTKDAQGKRDKPEAEAVKPTAAAYKPSHGGYSGKVFQRRLGGPLTR